MEGEAKSYEWSQKENEVHIYFKTDPEEKTKNITFEIVNKRIKITYNDKVILEGELPKRMATGTEFFVINGDVVDFFFNKSKIEWWDCLLVGSEKVDVKKLEANSDLDFASLDPESQRMTEQLLFDCRKEKYEDNSDINKTGPISEDEDLLNRTNNNDSLPGDSNK